MAKDKAYIYLEVQAKKATGDMRTFDKNTERAFDNMKQNARKASTGMGDSLRKLKQHWLAVAAAMTGVILGLKKCVTAASDLQETTSKFEVVFAGQIKRAEEWAEVLVESYAMSTREAKQYLSSMQDLLVPMGMARDRAAALSNEIVKLAADLGSFNNMPTAQVMGDIQSALVGNYETMKKYGVVLNATTVQQKALEMGLAASKDQLTAAHKAHAAYTMTVQGSEAAIGDMARTQDSYANTIKRFDAAMVNLAASIGTYLLPVLSDVFQSLTNIVDKFNEWNKARKTIPTMAEQLERKWMEELEEWRQKLKMATEQPLYFKFMYGELDLGEAHRQIVALQERLAFIRQGMAAETGKGGAGGAPGGDLGATMDAYIKRAKEMAAIEYAPPFDWEQYLPPVEIDTSMDAYIAKAKEMAAIEYAPPFDYEQYITGYDEIEKKGKETFDNLKNAVTGWASMFSSQLTDMIWAADMSFKKILESFGRMITQMMIQKALVEPLLGFVFPAKAVAQGAAFDQGRMLPYARGGIVDRPTIFPMAGGAGLMGEKGPEAIMPLARTRSGDLGVRAEAAPAGGVSNIEINMINQSGQPLEATQKGTRNEFGKQVLDVVITNLRTGRALRNMIRSTI